MRLFHIPFYCFCFVTFFFSCREEGTVARLDKEVFTIEDQAKIGNVLAKYILDNPIEYPIYDRKEYPELYSHIDELFGFSVNNPVVANRDDFSWRVFVTKDQSSMTAYSLPGGKIFITDGFLKFIKSEGQLISILSSEMYYTDSGVVMDLLHNNSSGLVLGDIVLNNPIDDYGSLVNVLRDSTLTVSDTKSADEYCVASMCPFNFAPDALANVLEIELSDTDFPLEWKTIRPDYEERIERIRSFTLGCEDDRIEDAKARYYSFIVRHLDR